MVGETSTIKIIYITNANETAAKTRNLSNSVSGLNTNTTNMTKSLIGAGAAMMVAHKAFAMMKKIVMDGVSQFREFELRIAEINTILSKTDKDILPSLSKGIEGLAIKFGKNTSDVAKGMYDIISAAFQAKDAMFILNAAVKASVAGLSDVRTSVDVFTTVLNAYGMSAYRAEELSDKLFTAVRRGKFEFKDLASALQYVVPIASQAGVTFDELTAILMSTTRHGLRLDMTARGLALGIQNIVSPTEQAKLAAEKYGIDLSATAIYVDGLTGVMHDLNEATQEYGNIIPEVIKNVRSMRVMLIASGEGYEGIIEDLRQLELGYNATNDAAELILDTEERRLAQAKETKEFQQRALGEQFAPVFTAWEYGTGAMASIMASGGNIGKSMMDAAGAALDLGIATIGVSNEYTDWLAKMAKLDEELDYEYTAVNTLKGTISELNIELNNATGFYNELGEEIEGTLNLEKERLLADKAVIDLTHDINMGLELEGYQYKTLSTNMRNAVNEIKQYENAQKSNREETQRYTIAMQANNLEIMKLQLRGMMRRRGLSRSEQRRIKQLRIETLQEKIGLQETQKEVSVPAYDRYIAAKEIVDKEVLLAKDRVFELNYTYDEDLKNMDTHMEFQRDRLDKYEISVKDHLDTIKNLYRDKSRAILKGLRNEFVLSKMIEGETLPTILAQLLRGAAVSRNPLLQYQSGTYRVPNTGLAVVHEGETISPRGGRQRGGGMGGGRIHVDPMHINVNIYDHSDVEHLVQKIELAIQSGLVSGITTGYS